MQHTMAAHTDSANKGISECLVLMLADRTWFNSLFLQDAFSDHLAPIIWKYSLFHGLSGSDSHRTLILPDYYKVNFLLLICVIISPTGNSRPVERLSLIFSCTLQHLVLCLAQGNTNRLCKMIFFAFPSILPKLIGLIALFSFPIFVLTLKNNFNISLYS